MPALAQRLDPNEVDPLGSFEPVPEGDYDLMLVGSSVESNGPQAKDPSGSFLKLELEVQTGPHTGRKLFDNITLRNSNVQAVEIGQRKLSALCHSMGWMRPLENSDDLHGHVCRAHVKIRPAPMENGSPKINPKTGRPLTDQNEIGHYIVGDAAKSKKAAPSSNGTATASEPARKQRPW